MAKKIPLLILQINKKNLSNHIAIISLVYGFEWLKKKTLLILQINNKTMSNYIAIVLTIY